MTRIRLEMFEMADYIEASIITQGQATRLKPDELISVIAAKKACISRKQTAP